MICRKGENSSQEKQIHFMIHILETPDLKLNLCNICPTQSAAIVFIGHAARITQHSNLNNKNIIFQCNNCDYLDPMLSFFIYKSLVCLL